MPNLQDDSGDAASLHLASENDSSSSLEEHLHTLADSLSLLCKDPFNSRKESILRQVFSFINNLKRFELDTDLIIKMKIGRFLSVIYSLLLELRCCDSECYSQLLVETSSLISKTKDRVLSMVASVLLVLLAKQRPYQNLRD